jgi:hypothetical protein
VLNTKLGPLFIDLDTCCRGPVEFDLAHVPAVVSEQYPDADPALLRDCRGSSWRWWASTAVIPVTSSRTGRRRCATFSVRYAPDRRGQPSMP